MQHLGVVVEGRVGHSAGGAHELHGRDVLQVCRVALRGCRAHHRRHSVLHHLHNASVSANPTATRNTSRGGNIGLSAFSKHQ